MDFNGRYILDDEGQPQPCEDLMTWGQWFERAGEKRRVAFTDLGIYRVSTVFLGLDHSFRPMQDPLTYKPVLWETIVFDWSDAHDRDMWRYTSRADALAGHEKMVNLCLKAMERHISLEDVEQGDQHDDSLRDAVPGLRDGQQSDDPAEQAHDNQGDQ